MKNMRITLSCLCFIALFCSIDLMAIKPAGVALMERIEIVADKNMPILSKASEDLGRNVGLGATIFLYEKSAEAGAAIYAGAAKVAAAVKTGATIIVASPATPYIVVGVGVAGGGYVAYRVYRYYNPTTGERIIRVEEEVRLQKAKSELNKAKAEKNKTKIELYKSKMGKEEAKKEMMAQMAAGMVASAAA